MNRNPVKEALQKKQVTLGTWIQLGHPGIAEVLANAGFDWIAADCEHSDIDIAGFTTLARGMYGRDAVPLARIKENDTLTIRQILDAGAGGVIVPLINSAEDACRAVSAAKFPPQGERGFSFSRANNYGIEFADYTANANEEILVFAMIESREAVSNIEEILAVKGVDGVFVGPYDMSGSYGVTGQVNHPEIMKACNTVISASKKAEKAAGIHVTLPTREAIIRSIADGFTFIALGMDGVFLDQGARRAIQIAREVTE